MTIFHVCEFPSLVLHSTVTRLLGLSFQKKDLATCQGKKKSRMMQGEKKATWGSDDAPSSPAVASTGFFSITGFTSKYLFQKREL